MLPYSALNLFLWVFSAMILRPLTSTRDYAPIATILAAAMMLRDSFGMTKEHAAVERAVEEVLGEGWRTADISSAGTHTIGCREMARRIADHI